MINRRQHVGSLPPPPVVPATWNPADAAADLLFSNGNLTMVWPTGHGALWECCRSTGVKSSGKWYAEATCAFGTSGFSSVFGICDSSMPLTSQAPGTLVGNAWAVNGSDGVHIRTFLSSVITSYTPPVPAGILRACVDIDAGKGWLGPVGSWFGGGDPGLGTLPTFTFTPNLHLYLCGASSDASCTLTLNTGGSAFGGTMPTAFNGWST